MPVWEVLRKPTLASLVYFCQVGEIEKKRSCLCTYIYIYIYIHKWHACPGSYNNLLKEEVERKDEGGRKSGEAIWGGNLGRQSGEAIWGGNLGRQSGEAICGGNLGMGRQSGGGNPGEKVMEEASGGS